MNANVSEIHPSKASPPVAKAQTGSRDAHDHIANRKSRELVIGISGPVGAGVPSVINALEEVLRSRNYRPVRVKISGLFEEQAQKLALDIDRTSDSSKSAAFKTIWDLQSLGNSLRSALGDDMGAQLAAKNILMHRTAEHPGVDVGEIEPKRTAFVIDQLKHPREVALLRAIYGDMFFMIGVLNTYGQRKQFLTDLGMSRPEAEQIIERDRKESDDNGQQLDKTLQCADFFVNNSRQNIAGLKTLLTRFIGLIHGDVGHTPNSEERGMFAAYSAGLRSACLSRQVGAAITDKSGNVISTGCNDVPRSGGGLYEPGEADRRCAFKSGYCSNDKYKDRLRDEIADVLRDSGIDPAVAVSAANNIRKKTRVKDLIEFSRAVHAEMDAIVGVARTGVSGIAGSTLFTTVYPCHNCARHIVAAGVSTVLYIEPYEKSLASDLHDDSIAQEPEAGGDGAHDRVRFMHFEGVSPQRFSRLFQSGGSRKDSSGKAIPHDPDRLKKDAEYLDDYMELEARVVQRLYGLETLITTPPAPSAA